MKKFLVIAAALLLAAAGWYFFLKEPAFKTTDGFLVNLNEKGVFIEGYDPVAYFTDSIPLKGTEQYQAKYNGGVFWFISAAHLNLFKKEPTKYAPQYGAFCGYAVSIGKLRPVDPLIYQIEKDRLILQHTQEAFDLFNKNLEESLQKADMKWPLLVAARGGKKTEYDKPASPVAAR
jgi:YHS domain-containing protein